MKYYTTHITREGENTTEVYLTTTSNNGDAETIRRHFIHHEGFTGNDNIRTNETTAEKWQDMKENSQNPIVIHCKTANEEHNDHCKSIVDDLKAYASGEWYKCPECGEVFQLYGTIDGGYIIEEDGEEHATCPNCGRDDEGANDWEELTLWDYFEDALDINYLVASDRKTLRGVRVLVAFGGPNIYIDTIQGEVQLNWWDESGRAWIPSELCEEIDSVFADLWEC